MGHIFKSLKGCFTWHCVFTALIIMAEKRSLLQWKVNSIVLFLCYHKAWESELVRLNWYFRKFFSLLCMTIDSESSNTEAFCTKVHHWKILLFCLTEISLWPLWARGSSCSSNITLKQYYFRALKWALFTLWNKSSSVYFCFSEDLAVIFSLLSRHTNELCCCHISV